MINKVLMAGTLLSISLMSFAESNWKIVGTTKENVYGIDLNSIANVSEYPYQKNKKAWIKNVIVNDLTKDGMSVGDYNMILEWVNCNDRTLGYKSNTAYKKDGTLIPGLSSSRSYVKMDDVIPGTIGESIFEMICNLN